MKMGIEFCKDLLSNFLQRVSGTVCYNINCTLYLALVSKKEH